jgi:hypothetical protein
MQDKTNKFAEAFQYLLYEGMVKSQEDFALKLQEDTGNISKYLTDKQNVPLTCIQKLIEFFELDANFFFHDTKKVKQYVEVSSLHTQMYQLSAIAMMQKRTIKSLEVQLKNLEETITNLGGQIIVEQVENNYTPQQELLP